MTSHILLVRPVAPGYNPETAASNAFQQQTDMDAVSAQRRVQIEFDAFAHALQKEGVDVIVIEDTPVPVKPDAVFPNNWVTFHDDGRVVLYPMFAPSRRRERRMDVVDALRGRFKVTELVDLSVYEKENRFLEGTGSLIFDHSNKVVYACVSPRTDRDLTLRVAEMLGYKPVVFHAVDSGGRAIYHTNVMMNVGEGFSIVCLASITDPVERADVVNNLRNTGHTIVDIDFMQMNQFAGNMLAVRNAKGEALLVCSEQAAQSLTPDQRGLLSKYVRLVAIPIPTIEQLGGGSARCMMAEVFLPIR